MAQADDDIMMYASVLEHAPILKAPAGYVPGPDDLEGLSHVGSRGWSGFTAPGLETAQFIAEAIEPFLRAPEFDAEAVVSRLMDGTPSALGNPDRALDAQEAERIVDVCHMLRIGLVKRTEGSDPFAGVVDMSEEPNDGDDHDEPTEGDVVVITVDEFAGMADRLVNYAIQGVEAHIIRSDSDPKVVARLLPASGRGHQNRSLHIIPKTPPHS